LSCPLAVWDGLPGAVGSFLPTDNSGVRRKLLTPQKALVIPLKTGI